MKTLTSAFFLCALTLLLILFPVAMHPSATATAQADDKLVYADFEKLDNSRPVSARGGWIQLSNNQENPGNPAKFIGMKEPKDAPELIHLKADDPNRAAMFGYELKSPNGYAQVTLTIHGLPDKDGKPAAEDVSGYKSISFQVYAKGVPGPTGVQGMRVELISHGQGIGLQWGFPGRDFKLGTSGFNTYKVALKTLTQPSFAPDHVKLDEVLKKLTEVNFQVGCGGGCSPINGTVIIDNVVFTKD